MQPASDDAHSARVVGSVPPSQKQAQEQFEGYVRNVATNDATATPTDQIAQAKQLLDAGTIDQAEFDRLKATALT